MTERPIEPVPLSESSLSKARSDRLQRVRATMATAGVECCLLSLGADLPWCTGYEAMPLERPTVLVVPRDDDPTLVVPALEAPRVAHDGALFRLRPWTDAEDPIEIVRQLVGARKEIALSDVAQARLLIDLQRVLPAAKWRKVSSVIGSLRSVKDKTEIASLAAAALAADRVATALLAGEIVLIGRREIEVSWEISARLIEEGHAKVNFAIVGSGPNAASPHHEPGDRVIGQRESVVCDFGGTYHLDGDVGYCSDITRTVFTGEPSSEVRHAYEVLEEAQRQAVSSVCAGITCESIDATGRAIITDAGYGEYFMHRIGHGIGVEAHEDPYIVKGNDALVALGNVFSVEPGIYIPGQFGARIEDIVAVTESGFIALNSVDHSLHVVEA